MGKNSYLRLGGQQNKSREKLIFKVKTTTKIMENKNGQPLPGHPLIILLFSQTKKPILGTVKDTFQTPF
jgi:hypothetical protein